MPRWEFDEGGLTTKQRRALTVLSNAGEPLNARELGRRLRVRSSVAASRMWQLQRRGLVGNTWDHRPGSHWYVMDAGRSALAKQEE